MQYKTYLCKNYSYAHPIQPTEVTSDYDYVLCDLSTFCLDWLRNRRGVIGKKKKRGRWQEEESLAKRRSHWQEEEVIGKKKKKKIGFETYEASKEATYEASKGATDEVSKGATYEA